MNQRAGIRNNLRSFVVGVIAIGIAVVWGASGAFAATNFATANQNDQTNSSYTNNTTSATMATPVGGIGAPIDFLGGLPGVPNALYSANFTMGATTGTKVTNLGVGLFEESGFSGTLTFTGTGANLGKNLLTVTFDNAQMVGTYSSTTAHPFVTSLTGSIVNFSSDLFSTAGWIDKSFSLTFGLPSGGITLNANGFLNSFALNGLVLDFYAATPEPLSMVLMLLGFAMVLSMAWVRPRGSAQA